MTIISNSHRFIYVHLHKCGGTSVERAYAPNASWNDLVLGSTTEGERLQPIYRRLHGLHKHSSAAEIRAVVGPVWDEYWTVALVRHPLRIYESYYKWIHKIVANFADRQEVAMEDVLPLVRSMEEKPGFIHYEPALPFLNSSDFNDFVLRFFKKTELRSQHARLADESGNLIIDSWYRLEELPKLWDALSSHVGLAVEHKHSNKGTDLELDGWSAEAEKLVRDMHAEDFEVFGYS